MSAQSSWSSPESVKSARMIRLEKFTRMEGAYIEGSSDGKVVRNFNMLGHYDLMTYIRFKDTLPEYENEFLIRYPYEYNAEAAIVSEQFFTLFDHDDPQAADGVFKKNKDPFEYVSYPKGIKDDKTPVLPILGLLLISVEMPMGRDNHHIKESYNQILDEVSKKIENACSASDAKISSDALRRLFSTHNCANLVMAIRTNRFADIYYAKEVIASCEINISLQDDGTGKEKILNVVPNMVITPFITVEIPEVAAGEEIPVDPLRDHNVAEMNKDVHFNVRFGLKKSIELVHKDVYGILGSGDSSVTLSYENYSGLYSLLLDNKYHRFEMQGRRYWDSDKFLEINGIDPELFKDLKKSAGNTPENTERRKKLLERLEKKAGTQEEKEKTQEEKEKDQKERDRGLLTVIAELVREDKIRSIYERLRFDDYQIIDIKKSVAQEFFLAIRSSDIQQYLNAQISYIHSYVNIMGDCRAEYENCISMLKDLLNTFFDLQQQNAYAIYGRIFVLQMKIIIDNVRKEAEESLNSQVASARKAIKNSPDSGTGAAGQKVIVLNHQKASWICINMKQAILAVNNYNKMLQSLNQYNVNFQSYEIQTRVNAEKYLLAYSCFIQEIFSRYNQFRPEKERIYRYPIVSMNTNADRIVTSSLFAGQEDKDVYKFFSVEFPNYRQMADIYHALPLLTHELSHALRYTERNERNKNVIAFVLDSVSRKMVDYLLNAALGTNITYHNLFKTRLAKSIFDFLYKEFIKTDKEGETPFGVDIRNLSLARCHKEMLHWFRANMFREELAMLQTGSEDERLLDSIYSWEKWTGQMRERIRIIYQYMGCSYLSAEQLQSDHIGNAKLTQLCTNVDAWELRDKHVFSWDNLRSYIIPPKAKEAEAEKICKEYTDLAIEIVCNITSILLVSEDKKPQKNIEDELETYLIWISYMKQCFVFGTRDASSPKISLELFSGQIAALETLIKNERKLLTEVKNEELSYSDLLSEMGKCYGREIRLNDILKSLFTGMVIAAVRYAFLKYNLSQETFEEYARSGMFTSGMKFDRFLMKLQDERELQELSVYRKSQMFSEMIGLEEHLSALLNIAFVHKDFNIRIPYITGRKKTLSERMHESLFEEYRNVYSKHEGTDYLILANAKNNRDFARLGIISEEPDIFCRNVEVMSKEYGSKILVIIDQVFRLYEEVYSDLGMCAAFNFTPFGYLRFTLHMNEQPMEVHYGHGYGTTKDRLIIVVRVLLLAECLDKYYESLTDETEKKKLAAICDVDQTFKEAIYNKEIIDQGSRALREAAVTYAKVQLNSFTDWLENSREAYENWFEQPTDKNGAIAAYNQIVQLVSRITAGISEENVPELRECIGKASECLRMLIFLITGYRKECPDKRHSPISLLKCDYQLSHLTLALNLLEYTSDIEQIFQTNVKESMPDYIWNMAMVYDFRIKNDYVTKLGENSAWTVYFREKSNVCGQISEHYNASEGSKVAGVLHEPRKNGLYNQENFVHVYYGKCRDLYGAYGYVKSVSQDPRETLDIGSELKDWLQKIAAMENMPEEIQQPADKEEAIETK